MSSRIKTALACALVGITSVTVAMTASGAFFVGGAVVKAVSSQVNVSSTVITDAEAGYDQAAYDACVDSAEDQDCE